MSYRGRLIWPFVARIARFDPASVAADSGFDDVFREPVQVADGTQVGRDARVDLEPLDLPCQVEDQAWEQLRMTRTGPTPNTEVVLVFHFRDLESRGLIDPVGGAALAPRVGDRLDSIHRHSDMTLVQQVPNPPGLYCVEAQPRSYGLSGGERNLLVCTFRERTSGSDRI